MFLHALEYGFIHPKSKEKVLISAAPSRRVIKLCEFKVILSIIAIKINIL